MKLNKLFVIGFGSLLLTSAASAKGKKRVFEDVDTDKDGKVSKTEFLVGVKSEDRAKKRFDKKDKDKDGFLSKKEFNSKRKGKKGSKKPKKKDA